MKKPIPISMFLLLFMLVIAGCGKDNNQTTVDTGTIRYKNTSSGGYRYYAILDGANLTLVPAGTYYDKTNVPIGSHIVKALQFEGYILYPTTKESTMNVTKGITLEFSFP